MNKNNIINYNQRDLFNDPFTDVEAMIIVMSTLNPFETFPCAGDCKTIPSISQVWKESSIIYSHYLLFILPLFKQDTSESIIKIKSRDFYIAYCNMSYDWTPDTWEIYNKDLQTVFTWVFGNDSGKYCLDDIARIIAHAASMRRLEIQHNLQDGIFSMAKFKINEKMIQNILSELYDQTNNVRIAGANSNTTSGGLNIITIDLSETYGGDNVLKDILEYINNNKYLYTIQTLKLSNCNLTDKCLSLFSLLQLPNLTTLYLDHNHFTLPALSCLVNQFRMVDIIY